MNINKDFLAAALTDHSGADCFFDRSTGDVILDLDRKLDEEDPRYIRIDPLPSWMEYNLMRQFADTVSDTRLRDRLEVALDGRGAFRRFKKVLYDYPDVEKQWFKQRDEWLERQVSDWLKANAPNDVNTQDGRGG